MNWETINQISIISSIIGFAITIINAIFLYVIDKRVKRIKTGVLFDKRAMELNRELIKSIDTLWDLLQDYNNKKREIKAELAKSQSILENLSRLIFPPDNKEIIKEIPKLKKMRYMKFLNEGEQKDLTWIFRKVVYPKAVFEIHDELLYISSNVKNLFKDKKKSI